MILNAIYVLKEIMGIIKTLIKDCIKDGSLESQNTLDSRLFIFKITKTLHYKMKTIIVCIILFSAAHINAQQFTKVATFGLEGYPEDFEVGEISDVALSGNTIYVLDDILNLIHVLEFSNRELNRVDEIEISEGRGPGEMLALSLISASEEFIAVADDREQKVILFNPHGELISEFVVDFRPTRLHVHNQKLLLTGFWPTIGSELVHVYDKDGNQAETLVNRPDNWMQIAQTGNFERILPAEDHLFISYPHPYKIEKYDWSGELLATFEDAELTGEIEEDGVIQTLETRIFGLQRFGDGILATAMKDEGYRLELLDQNLNRQKSITPELEHLSFVRTLDDRHILIRQLDPVPHFVVYVLE